MLFRSRSVEMASFDNACFHIVAGEIRIAEGHPLEAVKLLNEANHEYPMALSHESIARLDELRGDWIAAIGEWQQVLASRGEILHDHSPADWVLAHLAVARAYSKVQEYDSADRYYRAFLQLWKSSDRLTSKNEAFHELELLEARTQVPRG